MGGACLGHAHITASAPQGPEHTHATHLHVEDPGGENDDDEQRRHVAAPASGWNSFAEQGRHDVALKRPCSALDVPAGQAVGAKEPSGQKLPGGQM